MQPQSGPACPTPSKTHSTGDCYNVLTSSVNDGVLGLFIIPENTAWWMGESVNLLNLFQQFGEEGSNHVLNMREPLRSSYERNVFCENI